MTGGAPALIVDPEAAAELEEAVQWYERRSVGLGLEFARVIRAVFALIERAPLQFPEAMPGIRRAVVRRFPYAVYFTASGDQQRVLAVFHHRRDPAGWQSRG
ncbi:MAG: type II toxin-antitoxin system RelE/ParE family toxin [Gemmatimonadaceae bacterium]